jgi:hypothetical protein
MHVSFRWLDVQFLIYKKISIEIKKSSGKKLLTVIEVKILYL